MSSYDGFGTLVNLYKYLGVVELVSSVMDVEAEHLHHRGLKLISL